MATDEDMRVIEPSTAWITIVAIVVGGVLCALKLPEYGAPLITFAVGSAATKPLFRRDK